MVLAALAAIVAVGCGSSSSSGAASKVAVFPTAGTPTASARTQISFRGAGAAHLTGISVRGSRSGRHTGTVKQHSDGDGESFLPRKRFRAGETVTVRAGAALLGAHGGRVRFRIARHARIGVPGTVRPDPGGNPRGAQHFKSRPGLQPPTIRILKRTSRA